VVGLWQPHRIPGTVNHGRYDKGFDFTGQIASFMDVGLFVLVRGLARVM
jgi:hypothetical protein